MNLPLSRSTLSGLALLLLVPTAGTWQLFRTVEQQRAEAHRIRAELKIASAETEVVQSHIEEIRTQLESQKPQADPATTVESRVPQARSSQPDSADPWATPPEVHPDWNPASPYIWISRESLVKLPLQPFVQQGALDRDIAEILGISPDLSKQLHAACSDILRRREALEIDLAVASFPEPSTNRMQLDVQFPPETAQGFQSSFEAALRQHLGAQRAELVLTLGRSWIDEQFSPAKSITVTLLPGNRYEIASSSGGIFRSVGGISSLDGYVPPHLAHLFFAHFKSLKAHRAGELSAPGGQDTSGE